MTSANAVTTSDSRAAELPELGPKGQLTLDLTSSPVGLSLSEKDRTEAQRRYSIIEAAINPDKFRLLWLQCHNRAGDLMDLLSEQHGVPRRTLYLWIQRWKAEGILGLVNRARKDKGTPRVMTSAALEFIIAAALPKHGSYGALSVREIYRAYNEERAWRAAHAGKRLGDFEQRKYCRYVEDSGRLSAEAQLPEASYETFRVWFGRIPEAVKVLGRNGAEAFSKTQECISFRDLADLQPLEYVVMDHRLLDIFCLVPGENNRGWKLARPWLSAAIDMRTRKWLAWVIVENPSSDSIAAVLRRTFLAHGLPQALYWDHGKDFTCEWFEGKRRRQKSAQAVADLGTAWRGVLETLGVRVHHAIVKRARSKIIEPNFGNTSRFDETLPWFCGHKPTARPERFGELLAHHEKWLNGKKSDPAFPTIGDVAALYEEFLQALNEREHLGEGMRKVTPTGYGWMSPNECFERLIGKVQRRTVNPEVLAFAFHKRRTLKIRNGEINATFGGRQFHYRLSDPMGLLEMNGREVQIAYAPLDLGTVAVYRDGRFLGLAHNAELRRMGESGFIQDERDRRAARREVRKFVEAVHKQIPVAGYVERANRRAAARPVRTDPPRLERQAMISTAIVEAVQALERDGAFSKKADDQPHAGRPLTGPDLIAAADRAAYRDDDSEFQLFREENEEKKA